VDDVLGGEDAWKNVDRTQGMSDFLYWMSVEIFAVIFSECIRHCVVYVFLWIPSCSGVWWGKDTDIMVFLGTESTAGFATQIVGIIAKWWHTNVTTFFFRCGRRSICFLCRFFQQFLKFIVTVCVSLRHWWNTIAVTCPNCSYGQAYFMQIQIRSADEPMTTFYKCCNIDCSHRWKEN
jgi:hypothetical protein